MKEIHQRASEGYPQYLIWTQRGGDFDGVVIHERGGSCVEGNSGSSHLQPPHTSRSYLERFLMTQIYHQSLFKIFFFFVAKVTEASTEPSKPAGLAK